MGLQAMPPQTKSEGEKGVGGVNARESCTLQATSTAETMLGRAVEKNSQFPRRAALGIRKD